MPVLERSELEASPLADLHAIADQVGVDGFKRLRKADLIDKILAVQGGGRRLGRRRGADAGRREETPKPPRKRRLIRPRRGAKRAGDRREQAEQDGAEEAQEPPAADSRRRGAGRRGAIPTGGRGRRPGQDALRRGSARAPRRSRTTSPPERAAGSRSTRPSGRRPARAGAGGVRAEEERTAEGVVEVLANGSAFVRVNPPEQSPDDLYISSAQVRRCELVSGDRVSGPVRTPAALRALRLAAAHRHDQRRPRRRGRRRHPLRGPCPPTGPASASRSAASDPTLEAIEWLTPLGRGSRAVIVGGRFAGKSETLRRASPSRCRRSPS